MRPSPSSPPWIGSASLVAGTAAVAGAAGLLGVLRHEWWRDEAYTWLVVRASTSLGDLFGHLGFNGHPRGYYVVAYALAQAFGSPLSISVANLICSVLAVALFARSAPLPAIHKALFSISFFPLYQYGVVARSYSLFVLLLFLYAHLRTRLPARLAPRLACLALLAQVHLLSLAMASLLLAWEAVDLRDRLRASGAPLSRAAGARIAAAVVLVGGALAVAAFPLVPHSAGSVGERGGGFRAILGPATAFAPAFDRFHGRLVVALGLALFAAALHALASDRRTLHRCLILASPVFAVSLVLYEGYRWHHGLYFMALLVAVWMGGEPSRRVRRVLLATLALQAGVGLYALADDVARPYSDGRAVARAIVSGGYADLPLVGLGVKYGRDGHLRYTFDIDRIQPVLLDLPSGRAYDPRGRTFERFWRHYDDPDYFADMTAAEVPARLAAVSRELGSALVVVTVEGDVPEGTPVQIAPLVRLAAPPRALDYGESLGLYLFPRD